MSGPAVDAGADAPYWVEEQVGPEGRARFRARIGGLHCSLCTGTIEKALGRLPGVHTVAVSLTHEQALVEYDARRVSAPELLTTLRDIGYTIWDPRKLRPFEAEEAELEREGRRLLAGMGASLATIALLLDVAGVWSLVADLVVGVTLLALAFLILRSQGRWHALGGMVLLALGMGGILVVKGLGVLAPVPWVVGALAAWIVFGLARPFLRMAVQSLRRGILNQHVLLEWGAFAGLTGGAIGLAAAPAHYPTAAFFGVSVLVVTYHLFSEWLSLLVKTRSSQAVKRLLDLQPDTARVVRDGGEIEVAVAEVAVGDLVRVRPGERLPVDGEVVGGRSGVDQSLVTGEPMPVERAPGDPVVGGSINGLGTLLVRVTAVGEGSFLQQVIRHVEDARALKPGLLHLVDRILRVYAPAVLTLAALSVLGWTAGAWLVTGQADLARAVFAGLSVLVMGYPCAVGIAAPLAIVRGAGEAADQGIIMRTGEAFQAFPSVTRVVLDKTGTLTRGRPVVVEEVRAAGADGEVLAVAAAAEASSEHPLGQAIVNAALDRGLRIPDVDDFAAVAGHGVSASIGGARVLVGRPAYLEAQGIDGSALRARIAELEVAGHTVVAVARDGRLLGAIALTDTLRDDAPEAIRAMKAAGLIPIMVTGDNAGTAHRVARQVGIDEVHAGVLPGAKAALIRRLQRHGRVAMVGDGINDAPALMQAEIGIAMGTGTDIAIESADIIIAGDRLTAILTAREISRRSYRKTKQNVALAFLFNGLGIPAAATGLVYPVWAMVAMAVSVTSIFVNSLSDRPALFIDAVLSVGRRPGRTGPDSGA